MPEKVSNVSRYVIAHVQIWYTQPSLQPPYPEQLIAQVLYSRGRVGRIAAEI